MLSDFAFSVCVNMNSSYIKSFAVDKLLAAVAGAKTLATPVDSLETGFDLEAYRRRQMAAVLGATSKEVC